MVTDDLYVWAFKIVTLPWFNQHLLAYTLRAFSKQSRWLNFALLWAKGRIAGFTERTILTSLRLGVNAGLLWVLTRLVILQEGVWCQILYLTTTAGCRGYNCYCFYFFFKKKRNFQSFYWTWSFLLTLVNSYHGRPHFNLKKFVGFFIVV